MIWFHIWFHEQEFKGAILVWIQHWIIKMNSDWIWHMILWYSSWSSIYIWNHIMNKCMISWSWIPNSWLTNSWSWILNSYVILHMAYAIWHKNSNIWLFSLQRFDSFATFLQPPSSKLFSKPHKISLNPKP